MRNSSFVLALRYCLRSKLVFTSFCFQTVPKSVLTSAARIMDRNSQKWSQKGYSLPFAVKVSVRCSLIFKQSHSLSKRQGSSPHHSILPCNWSEHAIFIQIKGFLTACRNTAAYCIFLPFETPDSGSKFGRNQVFIIEVPLEWRRETGCQNESGIF